MIDSEITVLIPTSPIPWHPSTHIIDEVIASIRYHLPEAYLIIMMDGVREELRFRGRDYNLYKQNIRANKNSGKYGPNVYIEEYGAWSQQAIMTRNALDNIKTPTVLFVEHDTPLVTKNNPRDNEEHHGITKPEDCIIEWEKIVGFITSQRANIVRFYSWEKIWHEHTRMMKEEMFWEGARFLQTTQWSQWPNVASTQFYRDMFQKFFPVNRKTMIETVMASPAATLPWSDIKTTIYYPGENNRRFYHLNGRLGADGKKDIGEW